MIHLPIAALISFSVSFTTIYLLIRLRILHVALDTPNHRSLHRIIVPRTGGIGLFIGVFAATAYLYFSEVHDFLALWLLIVPLILISFVDDIKGVPFYWRFVSHFVIASMFVIFFLQTHTILRLMLLVLLIVWMINLFNFMDGSDGLAGGMSIFGFTAYAFAAYFQNDIAFATYNAVIASSTLGFLLFNFNPAKIFMGDSGSVPLGFLAAALGLIGYQRDLWPFWFPIIVFSPFIVDATVTLIKRLFKREKIWQAHRSHYYQRLVQMGFGHKKTAIIEYCLMGVVTFSALIVVLYPFLLWYSIVFWFCLYTILLLLIDQRWLQFSDSNP